MKYHNSIAEQPSCVLLCGRTQLLDAITLKHISQFYQTVMTRESGLPGYSKGMISPKFHFYKENIGSDSFSKIAASYSPDVVWYFSGFADGQEGFDDERKKIEELVKLCSEKEVSKLIVVSSVNALNYHREEKDNGCEKRIYESQKAFDCAQMEELVRFTAKQRYLKTVILRVPYIVNDNNKETALGEIFERMTKKEVIRFPYHKNELIDFLSLRNLAEALIAVTEETSDEKGEYTLLSGFEHTYQEFAKLITEQEKDQRILHEDAFFDLVINRKAEEEKMRINYGFVASDDIFESIPALYDAYRNFHVEQKKLKDRIKAFLGGFSKNTYRIAEIFLLFALVEVLLNVTEDATFFRYVDLRLFYVVILGITHGMLGGIVGGFLECISLVMHFAKAGVTGTSLFYNMDYWLPFAIYLVTGSVTGYMMSTKERRITFYQEENRSLQDKYLFLNNVYMSVIDNKEEYKRQILGYQDSFGKIFNAVEKLNSSLPADIFLNGVHTLERILHNHSIAIYTMDEYQKYGRLVACSREIALDLRKSISVEEIRPVYDTIRKREVWKNTDFEDNLPIYAYAIVDDNKIRLMICIYKADPQQIGLYYINLFTILCHLIRVSFRRALDYQEAIENEKYYPGTDVLMPEYFDMELESQRKIADAGMASFVLLQLPEHEVRKMNEQLHGLIRHSDILGRSSDGNSYLLLTQINRRIFDTIGDRLTASGVEYTIVEGM
ncbi:MAG: hypothetical protein K5739_11550 [Lachnospiraceae bacterium]|nr:hypothetical protein [Lachnospiraceae bacterium]